MTYNIVCMDYAKLLRHIREEMILSQSDLVRELGVAFATINRIEMGHNQPNYSTKRKIRDYCKKNKIEFKAFQEE